MPPHITAAMLYDLVQCTHRPAMDLFGDPTKRDEISPFVRLLWEKGTAYEHEVIDGLKLPMLDLSFYAGEEKEQRTVEAMQRGEPLIYTCILQSKRPLAMPGPLQGVPARVLAPQRGTAFAASSDFCHPGAWGSLLFFFTAPLLTPPTRRLFTTAPRLLVHPASDVLGRVSERPTLTHSGLSALRNTS